MDQSRLRSRSSPLHCAYCRENIGGKERPCEGCGVYLHEACQSELKGCPTLGCEEPFEGLRLKARALSSRESEAYYPMPKANDSLPLIARFLGRFLGGLLEALFKLGSKLSTKPDRRGWGQGTRRRRPWFWKNPWQFFDD